MNRISIVMTYFNRKFQLDRTLQSLSKSKYNNFNVVIVDDASDEPLVVEDNYTYRVRVVNIKKENKCWKNPEPAYNTGILEALSLNPDIVILQNAECYHVGDILSYVDGSINSSNYLSFGCYSIDEDTTFSEHTIEEVIDKNNHGAEYMGQNSWYNHTVHRSVGYDFCSAIAVDNIVKLNGYDERFSDGMAYGDNYLLNRIRMLGLTVSIIDNPYVVHQWHYSRPQVENQQELISKNAKLLDELTLYNDYRAKHIYTNDL